jgi:predicted lysophospholipase L1 biosynthesis ABC-type transport system permease subunit
MMIYEHYWRMQPIGMSFVVRTRADPRAAAGALRTVLSQADPEMALPPAQTMEQIVEDSVAPRRFQTWLAAVFAAAALLLASFGVYGVISFSVARRRPEIGIRIALGARAASVIGMVLMEGMRPVLAGLAAGIVTALLLGRIVRSQLYGIAANDPATICAVAAVLLIVAVCACWAPARRAARTDAMAALRVD